MLLWLSPSPNQPWTMILVGLFPSKSDDDNVSELSGNSLTPSSHLSLGTKLAPCRWTTSSRVDGVSSCAHNCRVFFFFFFTDIAVWSKCSKRTFRVYFALPPPCANVLFGNSPKSFVKLIGLCTRILLRSLYRHTKSICLPFRPIRLIIQMIPIVLFYIPTFFFFFRNSAVGVVT